MGGKTSVQQQQRLMDVRLIQKLSWRGASGYVDDMVMYACYTWKISRESTYLGKVRTEGGKSVLVASYP